MRYASVCSGVEAPSVAWERMGWKAVFFSEIEEFPSQVLKTRYPNVPNLGDMTKIRITENEITNGTDAIPFHAGDIDVFVGGTPCQDVSVAGRRAGLVEGSRSRLAFDFVRLAYEMRARWVIWENVPGVLSQNHGEDFAAFLSSLAGRDVAIPGGKWQNAGIVTNATAGNYGLAYRVLDAQYVRTPDFPFAIPQRRRRVFVVGHLGSWERAAEVLVDGQSLQRTPPPRREKGKGLASHAQGRSGEAGEVVSDAVREGSAEYYKAGFDSSLKKAEEKDEVSSCLCSSMDKVGSHDMGIIMQKIENNPTFIRRVGIGRCTEDCIASCQRARETQNDTDLVIEPMTYDSHPNDSRITEANGVQQALTSRCGTGGGNLPLVQERFCIDDQGGDIVHVNDKDIGCTVRATSHVPCVTEPCVVNDQGGSVIEVCKDTCSTLRAQTHGHEPIVTEPVCFQQNQRDEIRLMGNDGKSCGAVMAEPGMKNQNYIRRLYPVECERLMGFPDNYTRIPWKGKPEEECPDGHRYKACGNSMCVNCMEYLGRKIDEVEESHR